MYTLQGCINCDVFFRKCLNSQCLLEYSGDQDSVFFLSNNTCAGDEIGWDFISMVKNSKISFTAYCNEMTREIPYHQPSFCTIHEYKYICKMDICLDGKYEN